jgi:hypothetical protein
MTPSRSGCSISTGLLPTTAGGSARWCSKAVRSARRRWTPAARGLATHVLTGRFRVLRLSRLLGWADMLLAAGLAASGIIMLITSHHAEGLVLGVLGIISSGLFLSAGMARAVLAPKQLRRSAKQALCLNQDGT